MKKQLSFTAILKLISKAKTKKQIKKCTDLVVYFGGSPSKNTRLYEAYSKKHERLCYRLVGKKKKH